MVLFLKEGFVWLCWTSSMILFFLFFYYFHFIKHANTILNQFKVQNSLPIGSGSFGNVSADPYLYNFFNVISN